MSFQFPVPKEIQDNESIPPEARGQSSNEAFRRAISRAYGAWKDNPWTDHLEDINTTVLSNDPHLMDYHRSSYTAMPCVSREF